MFNHDSISVIILTYNRQKYLKASIESVLNQTIQNLKITVVDNASSDGTEALVATIMRDHDNVFYHKQPNHVPVHQNLHTAKSLITSEYVMFFHDDDVLHPQYVEYVLRALNRHPNVDLICSPELRFYDDAVPKHKNLHCIKYRIYRNQREFATCEYLSIFVDRAPTFPNVVYRAANLADLELDIPFYGKIADKPLMVSAVKDGVVLFFREEECLKYRIHAGQDSSNHANGPFVDEIIRHNQFFQKIMRPRLYSRIVFYVFSFEWFRSSTYDIDESEADAGTKRRLNAAYAAGAIGLYTYLYSRLRDKRVVGIGVRAVNRILKTAITIVNASKRTYRIEAHAK